MNRPSTKSTEKKLSAIPSTVQLPGGIRLSGVKFRVVAVDGDGRPTLFEMLAAGAPGEPNDYTLFANEEQIRGINQGFRIAKPGD